MPLFPGWSQTMRRLIFLMLLPFLAQAADEKCWEDPWLDTPDINMAMLIEDGYAITDHNFVTLTSLPSFITASDHITQNDYILRKQPTTCYLFFTCTEEARKAPVYECSITRVRIGNRTRAIHQCSVMREAGQMRRQGCN
ncbi:MAG: hypothetical protein HUJ31_11955 [Pseudomonadales bacterium]|nr:hypothetical protein [Pseudomonadales bacterium]